LQLSDLVGYVRWSPELSAGKTSLKTKIIAVECLLWGNLAVIQTMRSRLESASKRSGDAVLLWTFAMDDDQNQQAIRDGGGVIVTADDNASDCESLQMKA
jgi:hypothetical protein